MYLLLMILFTFIYGFKAINVWMSQIYQIIPLAMKNTNEFVGCNGITYDNDYYAEKLGVNESTEVECNHILD